MTKIYLFRADVAAYCDEAQELLQEIKKEYPGKIKLQIFDVERDQKVARRFGVSKVPTIIVDETARFTGVPKKEELIHLVESKRRRIPTGIGFVDAMTRGGMGRGDTVLVEGDVGAGKTSFCVQVAAKALNDGMDGIYVCTNETPDEIREKISIIEDAKLASKLSMVDLYSWRLGEIYRSDEAFTTESITDLPKLLAVIDRAIQKGESANTILFLDSVSELLLQSRGTGLQSFGADYRSLLQAHPSAGVSLRRLDRLQRKPHFGVTLQPPGANRQRSSKTRQERVRGKVEDGKRLDSTCWIRFQEDRTGDNRDNRESVARVFLPSVLSVSSCSSGSDSRGMRTDGQVELL